MCYPFMTLSNRRAIILTSAQAFKQVFLKPKSSKISFLEGSASYDLWIMCLSTTASPALQKLSGFSTIAGKQQFWTIGGRSCLEIICTSTSWGTTFFNEISILSPVGTKQTLKILQSQYDNRNKVTDVWRGKMHPSIWWEKSKYRYSSVRLFLMPFIFFFHWVTCSINWSGYRLRI